MFGQKRMDGKKSLKEEIAEAIYPARVYTGPAYEEWCQKIATDVIKKVKERIEECLSK